MRLSRRRYPESTLHFRVAWNQGAPTRYTIARGRADENRAAWDALVPAGVDADGDGKVDDRDEVPMAFTRQGARRAANGRSASHIAYVDASDNRGAGSYIGSKPTQVLQWHPRQGKARRPPQPHRGDCARAARGHPRSTK